MPDLDSKQQIVWDDGVRIERDPFGVSLPSPSDRAITFIHMPSGGIDVTVDPPKGQTAEYQEETDSVWFRDANGLVQSVTRVSWMLENSPRLHSAPTPETQASNLKLDEEMQWTEQQYVKRPVVVEAKRMALPFTVETLEGTMTGLPGDWLITGIEGEQYPCKHEIFLKTYEDYHPRRHGIFLKTRVDY